MARIDLRHPRGYFAVKAPRLFVGVIVFAVMLAMYFATIYIAPGKVTYALTVPALMVIIMTTVASLNDMDRDMCTARWNIRLLARLFVAAFALAQFIAPFANLYVSRPEWPEWRVVYVAWGLALYYLSSQRNSWLDFILGPSEKEQAKRRRRMDDFDGLP